MKSLLLPLLVTLAAHADPVLFSAPRAIPTAYTARSLTGGDFNRDGRPDFLVVDAFESIDVYLGREDGTFAPPLQSPLQFRGTSLAAGDYSGDGILDLATGGSRDHDVALFRGQGDGTFVYDTSVFAPFQAGPLGFGDFTGDGHLDLVAHGVGFKALHVWVNRGDASLRAAELTFLPDQLWGSGTIATADFDRDGKLDAVVRAGRETLVVRGNGDGTFAGIAGRVPGGHAFAVADFDSDGRPDLATVEERPMRHTFYVAMNRPDGTFPWRELPAGHSSGSIAAADMNRDGVPDLVTASIYSGEIGVSLSRNDGTFELPRTFAATSTLGLAVADYDGDGAHDVLLAPGEFSSHAVLVRGRGDGTLRAPRSYPTRLRDSEGDWPPDFFGVRLVDVTGDGTLDVVTLAEPPPAGHKFELAVLPGLGGGSFGPPVHTLTELPVNGELEWVADDFDGDGRVDVVLTEPHADVLRFYAAKSDGTFRLPVDSPRRQAGKLLAGDFTGDGKRDVAVVGGFSTIVYPGNGAGSFGPWTTYPAHGRDGFATDADGDGRSEIVFPPPPPGTIGPSPYVLGVADVDHDGLPDVVEQLNSLDLRVYPGAADRAPFVIAFDGRPWVVPMLTADVDRDGLDDMLVGQHLLLGNGDAFHFPVSAIFGRDAADLDGNGTLDFAIETISGTVAIVLTNLEEGLDIPTSLTLVPSIRSPRYGEEVTYWARVTADSPHQPGGVVRLDDNGRTIGYGSVGANGLAEIRTVFEQGSHTITATYSRNHLHAASTAPPVQHAVEKGRVRLSVSGSNSLIDIGLSVEGGSVLAQPSGTVRVLVDGELIRTFDILTSSMRFEHSLPAGPHTITVEYSGDANYEPATVSFERVVRLLTATVSLTATGDPLTLTARVDPASATGTVTFFDGETALLTLALHDGTASLTVSYLRAGPHTLTARYSGNDIFNPAVSAPVEIDLPDGVPPRPRRRSVR